MELEKRIERLEQTNRRNMIIAAFAGAIALASLFVGLTDNRSDYEIIRAKAFHVVSDKGSPVVKIENAFGLSSLGFDDFGTITTLDAEAENTVVISGDKNGSAEFFNSSQKRVAYIGSSTDGHGVMGTSRNDGSDLVSITSTVDAEGSISLYNKDQKELIRLGAVKSGDGSISIQDKYEQPRIFMGGSESGDSFVQLYGRDNDRLIDIGGTASGVGRIVTRDRTGSPRSLLSGSESANAGLSAIYYEGTGVVVQGTTDSGNGFVSTYTKSDDDLTTLTSSTDGEGMIIVYDPSGRRKRNVLIPLP